MKSELVIISDVKKGTIDRGRMQNIQVFQTPVHTTVEFRAVGEEILEQIQGFTAIRRETDKETKTISLKPLYYMQGLL